MSAVEKEDVQAGLSNADLTKALVGAAYKSGLVPLPCGVNGDVVRFLPALTVSDELIDEGFDILEGCLDACLAA